MPSQISITEAPTSQSQSWSQDDLRTKFTYALSEMYRSEVPLYGDLLKIVRNVDDSVLRQQGLARRDLPVRHNLERHGAIRIGSDSEMRVIKRLFSVLGMQPVGYYDLTVVDFPCTPPPSAPSRKIPYLLSAETRETVERVLEKRSLFTPRLLEILDQAEASGGAVAPEDADVFVTESLKIFKWHAQSTVSLDDYLKLKQEHPMIADIVCFPSAHINHLTPRTPRRRCPILLRQTSFKALEEPVSFPSVAGGVTPGSHTARFGEIEQRGAAVTRRGRDLYDELLREVTAQNAESGASDDVEGFDRVLAKVFEAYPDDWDELRRRAQGVLECEPLTYEDFLPLSAAGIFKSNLGENVSQSPIREADNSMSDLEDILGCKIMSQFDVYQKLEQESLDRCAKELGLSQLLLE
ncbi:unnamed protein product [Parascedosporium putredinis]|uniref:2-oxoadipate dioxygenase/decarboxylase n=1 Tax=Parascedosporium putredinis TaxID=1442378 RepID=A0A9P1M8N1_9PEZI|nr:unnamed protein product [Parascedosporium putredinis]CAI7993926.1 unnamed protein product [Parascedosporium putredinis]